MSETVSEQKELEKFGDSSDPWNAVRTFVEKLGVIGCKKTGCRVYVDIRHERL
jgi:hypothetical protein